MQRDNQTIMNPVKELDELYSKDSKVPQIDLEAFAREQIKKDEEKKFNDEMAKLQKELDQLESGKYFKRPFPSTTNKKPRFSPRPTL